MIRGVYDRLRQLSYEQLVVEVGPTGGCSFGPCCSDQIVGGRDCEAKNRTVVRTVRNSRA